MVIDAAKVTAKAIKKTFPLCKLVMCFFHVAPTVEVACIYINVSPVSPVEKVAKIIRKSTRIKKR